jgi:hypothetical protein
MMVPLATYDGKYAGDCCGFDGMKMKSESIKHGLNA